MGVSIFGAVGITGPDGALPLPGAKERAVLAILVSRMGEPVPEDRFVDALWPGVDPARARQSLRVRVSHVRRAAAALGARVDLISGGYRLEIAPDLVDLARFRSRAMVALDASPSLALDHARDALAEWTGDPFGEFRYLDPLTTEADELEALRRALIVRRAEALVVLDQPERAIASITGVHRAQPEAEDVTRALMRALAAAGRPSEAITLFGELVDRLAARGLVPAPETTELEDTILTEGVAGSNPWRGHSSNLPVMPPPIGRDAELASLAARVADDRAVTVVGFAGSGKTRLAIEIGRRLAGRYRDGIWWVDLTPLSTHDPIAPILGHVLDMRTEPGGDTIETIVTRLENAEMLIIFDNAERVAVECGRLVSRLTATSAGVSVLTTSRLPLGLAGEVRFRLDPLVAPPVDAAIGELRKSAPVRIFLEAAARIGVNIGDDELGDVARLVGELDGLPLAIELAAGRLSMLAPAEIVARLDDRLTLLGAAFPDRPRHQRSLEAALSWSVELLDEPAARLLAQLSVFAGSFSLAAVEAISGEGEARVIDRLSGLVDHSLVEVTRHSGRTSFRLLDSIRLYAADLLDANERDRVRRRHLAYFGDLVAALMRAPISVDDLDAMEENLSNIRRAFDIGLEMDVLAAARLAADSGVFWYRRSWWTEGLSWYRRLENEADGPGGELAFRLLNAAYPLVLFHAADPVEAGAMAERMITLAADLGIEPPYNNASLVHSYQGRLGPAMELLERAIEERRRRGTSPDVPMANLGNLLIETGEIAAGRQWAERALEAARRHGTELFSHARLVLIEADLASGRPGEAIARGSELLEEWERNAVNGEHQVEILHLIARAHVALGSPAAARAALARANQRISFTGRNIADHLLVGALVAAHDGRPDLAVVLSGAAEATLSSGEVLPPSKERTRRWAAGLEVVDGEPLRRRGRHLDTRAALELVAEITGAVTAVHEP